MAVDIKALREKLRAQNAGNQTQQSDNASYRFWDMKAGDQVVSRFLPDADESNPFFWRERNVINLEFDGIVGKDTGGKPITVAVPCVEMFGGTCPIMTEARKFYKDGRESLGQKYWKKKSYLFQSFIRQNPIAEDKTPENPIRRLVINPSIYKIIYQYIMDDDNEFSPTDYENGCDFRILKTQNGTYADYATSNFARKNSSLTEAELDAIEKFGLFNLSDFLPKEPDAEGLRIIQEMFEASFDGEAYDPARFGKFYRPYDLENMENLTTEVDTSNRPSQNEAKKAAPVEEAPAQENRKPTPQELLARIKRNG